MARYVVAMAQCLLGSENTRWTTMAEVLGTMQPDLIPNDILCPFAEEQVSGGNYTAARRFLNHSFLHLGPNIALLEAMRGTLPRKHDGVADSGDAVLGLHERSSSPTSRLGLPPQHVLAPGC